uniref:Ig-like domain-containing protein n=1 Tax=Hucho hucho TaxID=62062 RepID=A0A4W5K5I0_9TELE
MDSVSRMVIFSLYVNALIDASSWTAEVPSSVSGMQGSHIMIPCSFNYPEPKIKPSEFIVSSNIIQDYRGCTELVGDPRQKNCSLRIDPLHCSDKGPFNFRIEIKDHDKYLYKDDTVSIAVSSKFPREELTRRISIVGEVVSATCSVSHSCPYDSPLLTWSHSGIPIVQSQQLTVSQWEVTSSLNFTISITDHNQSLVCTAAYRGGKTVNKSETLNFKCKWTTSVCLVELYFHFCENRILLFLDPLYKNIPVTGIQIKIQTIMNFYYVLIVALYYQI